MKAVHRQHLVSIVVPTVNRKTRLTRCLDALRKNVSVPHEVIVVDGGSDDGTQDVLSSRNDVRVIQETRREGAVRAFNKGFRAACAPYVMWLNDDAFPLVGSVEAALEMLQRSDLPDVGMVAFYHNWHSERNVLDRVSRDGQNYELCHVRGYVYANFGLLPRPLLERIGFADEGFYFFGFDPDLALQLQLHEGYKVLGCRRACIHHEEHHDERKLADLPAGRADNERLFAKWPLPAANGYADPRPAYLKLAADRGIL